MVEQQIIQKGFFDVIKEQFISKEEADTIKLTNPRRIMELDENAQTDPAPIEECITVGVPITFGGISRGDFLGKGERLVTAQEIDEYINNMRHPIFKGGYGPVAIAYDSDGIKIALESNTFAFESEDKMYEWLDETKAYVYLINNYVAPGTTAVQLHVRAYTVYSGLDRRVAALEEPQYKYQIARIKAKSTELDDVYTELFKEVKVDTKRNKPFNVVQQDTEYVADKLRQSENDSTNFSQIELNARTILTEAFQIN